MSRFAELRALVKARQAVAQATRERAIEAELAKRPLGANERIIGIQRVITIDDALVRAEAEEADNPELLRVVRDLWTRSLQTRDVGTQWIAYETIRDGWRRHREDSVELAKYDHPSPPSSTAEGALLCPWPVLGSLGLKLKRHWETYLPKMTAELRAEGTLLHRLYETEQQMFEQEATLIQQGMSPDQARETTREIGFLPAEEDDPEATLMNKMSGSSKLPEQTNRKDSLLETHRQRLRKVLLAGVDLKPDPPPPTPPKK